MLGLTHPVSDVPLPRAICGQNSQARLRLCIKLGGSQRTRRLLVRLPACQLFAGRNFLGGFGNIVAIGPNYVLGWRGVCVGGPCVLRRPFGSFHGRGASLGFFGLGRSPALFAAPGCLLVDPSPQRLLPVLRDVPHYQEHSLLSRELFTAARMAMMALVSMS